MSISRDEFAKAVVASGLMTADDLKAIWNGLPADSRPRDGQAFAEILTGRSHLTEFQAAELLAGRGKSLAFAQYVLRDRIGSGGMGQVFMALHRRMDRLVAVKKMAPDCMKDENNVKRFHREVRAAAKLSHPNIVAAYDADEADGVHFLVMEYVEGCDLSSFVKQHGPLSADLAVSCVLQAARGLAFAHDQGVVHRDIKPANLLLDQKGVVKILDMGLARIEDPGKEDLTTTEQVMGTVDYMSPEQAENTHGADARSDIYSLGCTLWYLLTMKKIFDGETLISRMIKHRESQAPSLRAHRADVSAELDEVYQKMVAKNPADRFATTSELVAALESLPGSMASRGGRSSLAANPELAAFLRRGDGDSLAGETGGKAAGAQAVTRIVIASTTGVDASSPSNSTNTYLNAEVDTDPDSASAAPRPLVHAEVKSVAAESPSARAGGRRANSSNVKLIAGGLLGFVLVLAGVIAVIRDKDGKEVSRVRLPEGGTVSLEQEKDAPAPSTPAVMPATPATPNSEKVAKSPTKSKSTGGSDLDREVAEWVIQRGGSVWFNNDGNRYDAASGLPANILVVRRISVSSPYTLDEIKRISSLRTVNAIELGSGAFTVEMFSVLGRCKNLRTLWISGKDINDEMAMELLKSKSLRSIQIVGSSITDKFLAAAGQCRQLESLDLFGCKQLTDAGLALLAADPPPKLASLYLPGVNIGGEGLKCLAKLPHLSNLNIVQTKVDDTAVLELASAPTLSQIVLNDTLVTSATTTKLQEALGGCRITVSNQEQAPQLYNDAYFNAIRSLSTRGWSFELALGSDVKIVSVKGDVPLPTGTAITTRRMVAENVPSIADLQVAARVLDVQELHFSFRDAFVENGLREILPLKNLLSLTIIGQRNVTHEDVKLLMNFKKLRILTVPFPSDCTLGERLVTA